jgi:DNA polymerase III subunit delta
MDFSEFKKETQGGRLRPAYLFSGIREMELGKMVALLEKAPVGGATGVIREEYQAAENLVEAFVSASSRPMWGEHKVLLVLQADRLALKSMEKMLNRLKDQLKNPSEWVTWVLWEEKASSLGRSLKGCIEPVTAPKVNARQLAGWVRQQLKEAGIEIEPDAVDFMLAMCHEDWMALEREMEKVLSAFSRGKIITRQDLSFLVAAETTQSIFDLLPLVADGKTGAALEKMNQMLHQSRQPREEVMHLWYWFYRQARELLIARQVVEEKRDWSEAVEAGLRPKAKGILTRQAKKYCKSDIHKQLQALYQVDRQLKSSYTLRSSLLLERYLAASVHKPGKKPGTVR